MRYGFYKWVVIPMGLMNIPPTFMHIINNLFSDMLESSMVVFLDNILMYSRKVQEHYILLIKVLACLY